MMKECVKEWLNEQCSNDADVIAAVWAEYLNSSTEYIGDARKALEAFNFPELDSVAHKLKGIALMVGDQPSATAAIALRDAAKASDSDAAAKAIETLAALDQENHA